MTPEKFFKENEDWKPYADYILYPPTAEEMHKMYEDIDPEVLERCMELVWEGGATITRGVIYIRVRTEEKASEPHKTADRWASMLALQAPPGAKTDCTFWAGRKTWVDVFGEEYANNVKAQLAKKGVKMGPQDEYMPELAARPFDPDAVVPFNGARDYMKKLCERRGWGCNGAVTVKHRMPDDHDPTQIIPMGEDLIRRKAVTMVRKNPELRKLTKPELRQMVLEKHGPSKTLASTSLKKS